MTDAWTAFRGSAASTAAALTNASVQASPGTGKKLITRQVLFSNEGTANAFTLKDGSGGSTLFGPVYLGANQSLAYRFVKPLVSTSATALVVDTTASDHANVVCEGSIE